MEIHQIKYFLAVVKEGNFSRAASACNVTQPSLTRGIRKLEADLGGLLFDRKVSGAELTDLGRQMLPRLERAHQAVSEALDEAHGARFAKKRQLRVGLVCTLGPQRLVDLFTRLERSMPDFELSLKESKARDVIDQLLAEEIDVGMSCQPAYPDEVAVVPLFTERYAVAFRQGHRFEEMTEIPLEEMIGENYLERLNCEFDDYYTAHFGDRSLPLNIRYSSEREDWVQAMILVGLGVAFVPEFLPLLPGIEKRLVAQPAMAREISLLTVRGRPRSSVADMFVRLASAQKWQSVAAKS